MKTVCLLITMNLIFNISKIKAQDPIPLPKTYTGKSFVSNRTLIDGLVIKPWEYDSAGPGIAYHNCDLGNAGAEQTQRFGCVTAYRPTELVSIDAPTGSSGNCNPNSGVWQVGWFRGDGDRGSWIRYTFNVPANAQGNYNFFIKYSSGSIADIANGDTLNLWIQFDIINAAGEPQDPNKIYQWYFNQTGAWYSGTSWQGKDTSAGTVNFTEGIHVLTVHNNCLNIMDPGDINLVQFRFEKVTGINELVQDNNLINVYPTLCKNQLTVEMNNICSNNNINIVDITGRQVMTFKTVNQNKININTINLQSGIYFLTVRNSKTISMKRFIKN